MLMYDYIVTFPYEVRLFWRRKATGATLLFFAIRYLTLFIWIFDAATIGSMSNAVSPYSHSHQLNDINDMYSKDVCIHLG